MVRLLQPRLRLRPLVCLCSLLLGVGLVVVLSSAQLGLQGPHGWMRSRRVAKAHVIDDLIREAKRRFGSVLTQRSLTLHDAAARYRQRRGRHPPPGFDVWFQQALADDAIVVEDFFDRIHHDINPLWALEPRAMRAQTRGQPQVIRVRNGSASFETDDASREPWIQLWTALVQEMAAHLPDMDMVINYMDETRILVPWETMAGYVATEQASRRLVGRGEAKTWYSGGQGQENQVENQVENEMENQVQNPIGHAKKGLENQVENQMENQVENQIGHAKQGLENQVQNPTGHAKQGLDHKPPNMQWISDHAPRYWDLWRLACPPDSPGRRAASLDSFAGPVDYPAHPLPYMHRGFIRNTTQARDGCLQPHLRGMHGTFVESVSINTTHALLPMFGGSKLPQNNELLIPGAMYLSERDFYSGGDSHGPPWARKRNALVWRGTASGGRNKADNWWHFHRHRWVQMMNGTTVSAVEAGHVSSAPCFALPRAAEYLLRPLADGRLGQWLSRVADVAFVHLECFPPMTDDTKTCPYSSPYMAVKPSLAMKQQYQYKFLPDVDGNSFSARWRAFLLSSSLPLKATIYTEWHDDRIMPWVHFVPFDNSYRDIYALLDYLVTHDAQAERIASEGQRWAERVLRRADMKLYVWRLLLEYARVIDDERDYLAYVADLK
ncbi:hypothetical protein CDD82_2222 [Ophiocordyceps australis]|uniref:Glycosyl transferase CAP10 domain-containing protein n=1 Tax=Ophiocordyceps australis TaxID=1399860 RepID=A0A2C5XZP6_9HYPO|nr:hypothetical protein CDD82_2222 [Ophiocordyceps australis]